METATCITVRFPFVIHFRLFQYLKHCAVHYSWCSLNHNELGVRSNKPFNLGASNANVKVLKVISSCIYLQQRDALIKLFYWQTKCHHLTWYVDNGENCIRQGYASIIGCTSMCLLVQRMLR